MFRIPQGLALLTVFVILSSFVAPAAAADAPYVEGEILVAFRQEAGLFRREAVLDRVAATLDATRPQLGYQKYVLADGASVEDAVAVLENDPDVLWVEPNYLYSALGGPLCPQEEYLQDLPASPNQWGIFSGGIEGMWKWGGGGDSTVTIAIIDSGIDDYGSPHPDLDGNSLIGPGNGRDFVDDDFVPTDAGPWRGHGTNVAGVAAADVDSLGIAGVAYCSRLMHVRVLDCNFEGCTGSNDDIAQGIEWAADNGAKVLNLSLGGPAYSQAMRNAILHAIEQKCIVVAASGNDSLATLSYPARYPETISVGATDSSGDVAAFSNYSADLDVVAPGVGIWTPDIGDTWDDVNGTSFAAPYVSGVAALLVARNPGIRHLEVREWLADHTVPTASPARDGAGEVYYQALADFGDHEFYPTVGHANSMWEWLGGFVTAELSDTDPDDTDGVPNVDLLNPNAADLGDDNLLLNLGSPPWASARWAPGKMYEVTMSVSDFSGPRYDGTSAKALHLDQWIDWNNNGVFEGAGTKEHTIVDHVEHPGTWGADAKSVFFPLTPADEHIWGNPLHIRTRLNYGGPNTPDTHMPYGEVEDDRIINFVEDFDTAFYTLDPMPFMAMFDTWAVVPDPQPEWSNHGAWEMARCEHPRLPTECTGTIEFTEEMVTPPMDWNEYTHASINYKYNHFVQSCGPFSPGDHCRVEVRKGGVPVISSPIPFGPGSITIDAKAATGTPDPITVHWICDTDDQGFLMIDDITIVAIDDEKPTAVAALAAVRATGSRDVALSFTAPFENEIALATKEPLASAYEFRYAPNPIANEIDFGFATPILPTEVVGGALPMPGAPGAPQGFTFRVPSAHQTYHFAARAGDEVVHLSPLSNVPSVTNTPTIALAVAAPAGTTSVSPGDSTTVNFTVTNSGNATDIVRLNLSTLVSGWDAYFVEGGVPVGTDISVELAGGANTVVTAGVVGSAGAGTENETLRLAVRSTCDTTKTASGDAFFAKDATPAPVVSMPTAVALDLAGPNPFGRATAFRFAAPTSRDVQLALYDVTGRRVRTFLSGTVDAGIHRIEWDGRNGSGKQVPSGIYFLKVTTDGLSETKRVVRMR